MRLFGECFLYPWMWERVNSFYKELCCLFDTKKPPNIFLRMSNHCCKFYLDCCSAYLGLNIALMELTVVDFVYSGSLTITSVYAPPLRSLRWSSAWCCAAGSATARCTKATGGLPADVQMKEGRRCSRCLIHSLFFYKQETSHIYCLLDLVSWLRRQLKNHPPLSIFMTLSTNVLLVTDAVLHIWPVLS